MSAETATHAALSTHSGLTALVGTRIYPLTMPQDCPLPAVTYQLIDDIPQLVKGAKSQTRMQVDAWSDSFGGAVTVAAQVLLAMDTIPQCTVIGKPVPLMDGETGEHRRTMDFYLWLE